METAIERYNKSRGVFKTSVHLFRNGFACGWLKNGGSKEELQQLLCHKTIAMTNEYVKMYQIDLKKNFSKFNPLDSMMGDRGEFIKMKKKDN